MVVLVLVFKIAFGPLWAVSIFQSSLTDFNVLQVIELHASFFNMSDMDFNSITKLLIPKTFAIPSFLLIYKPFDIYKRRNIKFSKRFMSVLLSKTQNIHTTIRVLVQTPDYGNMGCRIFKGGIQN